MLKFFVKLVYSINEIIPIKGEFINCKSGEFSFDSEFINPNNLVIDDKETLPILSESK